METTKPVLNLVVEAEGTTLWGRIHYNDILIVDEADNIEELEKKMRTLILKEYKLKASDYELQTLYDISALFKQHKTLNATLIAERAGINRSLMAQYVAGIKYPSLRRTAEIQQVIHEIGNELRSINLAVKMEPVALSALATEATDPDFFEGVDVFVPGLEDSKKKFIKVHWAGKIPESMAYTQDNVNKLYDDLIRNTSEADKKVK